MGEMLATQLTQASKVTSSRSNRLLEESSGGPKWAWLLFAPPFTKYTPFVIFCLFLPETLQNFTDYVTTPIFFPECCETLRIMQKCHF